MRTRLAFRDAAEPERFRKPLRAERLGTDRNLRRVRNVAGEPGAAEARPEALLGAALRRARQAQGISLRGLAKKLYRAHSTLVEYERGHRLAPRDVVQAYETELGVA